MRKGTAVRKDYQNEEIDTSQPAVPATVSVALGELAGEMREGLLALAVGTGLQVLAALMEADVTAACGPKGRHDPERTATRHGHGAGSVSRAGDGAPAPRERAAPPAGEGGGWGGGGGAAWGGGAGEMHVRWGRGGGGGQLTEFPRPGGGGAEGCGAGCGVEKPPATTRSGWSR